MGHFIETSIKEKIKKLEMDGKLSKDKSGKWWE